MVIHTMSKAKQPSCVGTGLISLDVVLNGSPKTPAKFFTGGSCGNVLTILSYLGWKSFPVAKFLNNHTTKALLSDLRKWNVDLKLISEDINGNTPIIIHRIFKDRSGKSKHKFEFTNPFTHKLLPRYRPLNVSNIQDIIKDLPNTDCFYFDRVSRATLEIVKYYKKQGVIIFYEPSSIAKEKLISEFIPFIDIVKYSKDRISNFEETFSDHAIPLIIETLGKDGLQYKKYRQFKINKWEKVSGYKIDGVVDAAGAGDWTSAGILDGIIQLGNKKIEKISDIQLRRILEYAQKLGALNCVFDGARGMMYHISASELNSHTKQMRKKIINRIDDKTTSLTLQYKTNIRYKDLLNKIF